MNEKYERNCPMCNKLLQYKSNTSWNLAKRRNARCRNCSTKLYAKRIGDASFLLNETNESFYWIGFIMADGTFDKSKRLSVTLSDKDKTHLEKLSNKLGVKCRVIVSKYRGKEYNQVRLSIMHTEVLQLLTRKFGIYDNKTYKPPNISIFDNFNREQLLSLFVGFIDGDGSIGKKHNRGDFHLRIKCHSSWIRFLEYFNKKLGINSPVKINNNGYSLLQVSNYNICKNIKTEMLTLGIPFLDRKWDIIDLSYFGKKVGN